MAKRATVLAKIETLEGLVRSGFEDSLMGQTVEKLLRSQMQRHRKDLRDLRAKLRAFEKRSGMDSEAFHDRFHRGQLGDREDYFEWDALVEMEKRVADRLCILHVDS